MHISTTERLGRVTNIRASYREVPASNFGQETGYTDFRGFTHFLQANAGVVH
jgi:hypothetical protein